MATLTLFIIGFFGLVQLTTAQDRPSITTDVNQMSYHLYSKHGDESYREEIVYKNDTSLKSTMFQSGAPTVFITHGYIESMSKTPAKLIVDGYVNTTNETNVIAVDWGKLAGHGVQLTDHLYEWPIAVSNIPRVGKRLAEFIQWLNGLEVIDMNSVHLIGFSLGAHVMGSTGTNVQKLMDGFKIPRITGLDPHPYLPPSTTGNLKKECGAFVDMIHTSRLIPGEKQNMGHVDIAVNSLKMQPGCTSTSNLLEACSHTFAPRLYASTFSEDFVACKCDESADSSGFKECMAKCPDPVLLGATTPHNTRGIYAVTTGELDF